MDDWDTADIEATPAAAVVNQWEGEDEEQDDVLDSWDAEPEEKPAASALPVPEKKKAITKRALQKKEEEERRLAEKMAAAAIADPNSAAERERLRALEEARDAALAGDLFGADSVRPLDASSDLPGSKAAASASASASAAPAAARAVPVIANDPMKGNLTLQCVSFQTDADVDRFVSQLSKSLEKVGKSALASKRVAKLVMGLADECVKLGVLRTDDVGELKRQMTVRHNELTAKAKKGDKRKQAQPNKPVVQLARNAFMHGDDFGGDMHDNFDAEDDFM